MIPGTDHEYNMATRHGLPVKEVMELINEFNESTSIATLDPFADSIKYVAKLANDGYRFIAVTSISSHPDALMNRMSNLKHLFGDVFDEVVCLSTGASKANVLMRWAGSGYYWIEDHMRQAEAGHEAGLRPILINHPYNSHYETDLFLRVSYDTPWEEIYSIITSSP